ncbi:hypothetical protein GCM10007860_03420 [Chitiniphilus shinanonensis]|uniref:DUF2007 domain-containing protein n=1 Tax=Chitiniphilus shinanonensis TaxID=553088 RepID=A0ABQ6BP19_9NEIS|nr:DUF2007 domain-containing protein [Chitiniphilus shinanonensis]GLS03199.1 hypothetical protein GCM10007860_03420 [Chitiniphilus shinanonensis]
MQRVFEASNGIEAHLVKHWLDACRIPCEVRGEYLQGALGELPVGSLVALWVEDHQADQARDVIAQWFAAAPGEDAA